MTTPKLILGSKDVGELLGVGSSMVRKYIRSGLLKPRYVVKGTRAYLFSEEDVQRFLKKRDKARK